MGENIYKLVLGILIVLRLSFSMKIHVVPETGDFVDEVGRVRMFRGINSVVKHPPYYDKAMTTRSRIKDIQNMLGMNFVRLGYMWTGLQPSNSKEIDINYKKSMDVSRHSKA